MSRSAGGFDFYEVDEMICTFPPAAAQEQARHLREHNPDIKSWQVEAFINHEHPTHETTRQGLREAQAFAQELAAALRQAYPKRDFILLRYGFGVIISFFQRTVGAPETNIAPTQPLEEVAYCDHCQEHRHYTISTHTDEEFPWAEWGACRTCDNEMLLRTWEVYEPVALLLGSSSDTEAERHNHALHRTRMRRFLD